MEKLVKYRSLIKELLTKYVGNDKNGTAPVEEQLIFDSERDHYQLLALGWENTRRVFFCILHLDIKNNKIWLQENSSDYDIVQDLVALGVPVSDIVIGFHPADVRALTEFAVS